MTLFNTIVEIYPELQDGNEFGHRGSIELKDDSDGQGAYISKWEYSKPLPDGMKVGKN
jgi:hypothetical protein